MPTTATIIANPLPITEVFNEERRELLFDTRLEKKVLIAPWRTLFYARKLDTLNIYAGQCDTTILKWSWDLPEVIAKFKYLGIRRVFCTSPCKDLPFIQHAYPDYVKPEVYFSEKKDIKLCFVGWNRGKLRNRIFELYPDLPSVIKREEFYLHRRNKEHEQEFCDILARSRYSICPRGVGSGTYRFWESLKAGAIPIVISDEWRYPTCWNWAKTSLNASERSINLFRSKIDALASLRSSEEQEYRQNCREAHEFFQNDDNIFEYINACRE